MHATATADEGAALLLLEACSVLQGQQTVTVRLYRYIVLFHHCVLVLV